MGFPRRPIKIGRSMLYGSPIQKTFSNSPLRPSLNQKLVFESLPHLSTKIGMPQKAPIFVLISGQNAPRWIPLVHVLPPYCTEFCSVFPRVTRGGILFALLLIFFFTYNLFHLNTFNYMAEKIPLAFWFYQIFDIHEKKTFQKD